MGASSEEPLLFVKMGRRTRTYAYAQRTTPCTDRGETLTLRGKKARRKSEKAGMEKGVITTSHSLFELNTEAVSFTDSTELEDEFLSQRTRSQIWRQVRCGRG